MILHNEAYAETLDIIRDHRLDYGFNTTPENLAEAICTQLTETGFTVDPAEKLVPILLRSMTSRYDSPESITENIANDYGWMVTRTPRKSPELTEWKASKSLQTANAKKARRNAGRANLVNLHDAAEAYAEDYQAFPVSGDTLARKHQTI